MLLLFASIGSLGMKGRNEKVEFVHVNNVSFTETQNGVRIKTWQVINYLSFQRISSFNALN